METRTKKEIIASVLWKSDNLEIKDRAWKKKKSRNRVLRFSNKVGRLKSAFYLISSYLRYLNLKNLRFMFTNHSPSQMQIFFFFFEQS